MEEVAQEVAPDAPEVDAPEVDAPEVDAPEVDAPEVDAPEVPEVTPAAPVKRPRGRPRKNPEEPKRPRGRPRKEKEVRFEEAAPEVVPEPSLIPDAMYVLAQALLQNEAEARRRNAERYKNMLGL